MAYLDKYKVNYRNASVGKWKIEQFEVDAQAEAFGRIRAMRDGRFVPAGTYTGLYHGNHLVMSDTPDEIRDHLEFIHIAKGSLLISGLGLGVVLKAVLEKESVRSVIVVEKSAEVIELVSPHFKHIGLDRLAITHADIFEWRHVPKARFDFAWHDIWNDMCADNLSEMKKLHRKFGRSCGWQGSWGRDYIESRR